MQAPALLPLPPPTTPWLPQRLTKLVVGEGAVADDDGGAVARRCEAHRRYLGMECGWVWLKS